ncbi:MAG: DNA polymerase I [Gemmatimonadota bacterium]|nr:MAG: DNA polymerase I [Gemmatimonadota bacterium]
MDVPEKTAPRLFLIDAYALIYRAYFAFINKPLTNSRGENTSAPFGFVNFLMEIRERHQPDYLAVVFDSGMSHRDKIYPEYKATRDKMPDDLRDSLPRIRELVAGFNDALVELEDYEADDVIATLAAKAREAGLEAVIVSGDKDLYQLVGPGVHLLNPGRGGRTGVAAEWVDEHNAHEKFGVPASKVVDYLALVGDSSDNIPGAAGVGPKTALKLLEQFGSLDEILARADEISGKRARESLTEQADQVRLSRQLVTLMKDLDVELDLERLQLGEPDPGRLHKLFVELEFRRLSEQFAPGGGPDGLVGEESLELRTHLVTDADTATKLADQIREGGTVALAVYPSGSDPHRAHVVGIGVAMELGEAHYLSFAHSPPGELDLGLGGDDVANLPALDSPAMRPFADMLEDPAVAKVGGDLKTDMVLLAGEGVALGGVTFDIGVASYVLDPSRRQHTLDALALDLLGVAPTPYNEVVGSGQKRISFAEVEQATARTYAGQAPELALRLYERFGPQLDEQGLAGLFADLEMTLVPTLARMERAGIRIDDGFFKAMSERLERDLKLIREEIYKVTGEEFNLNSTQQLREILFEKQQLPVLKRTKTGPSTDSSVLEELAAMGHEVPRLMMEYRELEKLRSTYVDALPQLVNPRTGRIHTRFNQTVAATGRLSSSEPNLQNIPIRTDLGREIRKGFIPATGYLFYGADYSQVELRILAHFSADDAFVMAFRQGIDVHKQTASVIFDVALDDVTAEMRGQAKTINFATLYGQGAFSLARQLGIEREQAQAFIDQYFERFAGVRLFLDSQIEMAREKGYVETLSGRRRFVPELMAKNWNIRQFGERVAQNTPIQGTAADMIKLAMIDIQAALDDTETGARMLLQVHDELLFEVPEGEEDALAAIVIEKMEGAMELDVPLVAEGGVGRSWYETKDH